MALPHEGINFSRLNQLYYLSEIFFSDIKSKKQLVIEYELN